MQALEAADFPIRQRLRISVALVEGKAYGDISELIYL
jgi:hypothetical protein